ncbi:MAG: hypothetical protein QW291_01230 [Thermofilaceae archaeon]
MTLVTLVIEPVNRAGKPVLDEFTVFIYNFTEYEMKNMSNRIEVKELRVSVRIWKMLNIYNEWMEHWFTVVAAGKEYFGAKLVRIRPEKPIMKLKV